MADYLKLPEVARRLDVSEKTARRMVRSGKLPAVFIGGAYRVSEEDLAEYLKGAKVHPKKAIAPPSPQRSFNGLLEEERHTQDLERIEKIGHALHKLWQQVVERGEFDKEAYHRTSAAYTALDAALAEAMTEEFIRDEEGGSDAYRAAWHRAWQATDDLRRQLHSAHEQLLTRLSADEAATVPDVPDEVAARREARRRATPTGDERGSEVG
jgi:excisionase family DNA binding protein